MQQAGMHLDTYQEEVDLPDDCVLQVIPALVILKLDVKTVLYAHFHLRGMQGHQCQGLELPRGQVLGR